MLTVIINQNSASESALNKTLAAASSLGAKETLLIGSQNQTAPEGVSIVASKESDSGAQLLTAVSRASGSQIIIIDASAGLNEADLQSLLAASKDNDLVVAGDSLEINSESISSITSDLLIDASISNDAWPVSAYSSSKKHFEALLSSSPSSAKTVLTSAMVQAISEGLKIEGLNFGSSYSLDESEKSQLLEFIVNNSNIEDLFPNHAWKEHGEESAAACYHTLAALFLKLNRIDAALECLAFSDRLEDSPRSLALKALIAANKGETLGAVANMVSSLQEYEKRKVESKTHYLNFIPTDLDTINQNLNAGLEALNKRDNETALEHFSKAVFNFDSFFTDTGVSEKIN